jgi:hypothetical protein
MATLGGYPICDSQLYHSGRRLVSNASVCNPTKVTPNATYSWGVTSSTTDPSVTPVVHLLIVSPWIPQVCTVAVLFLCMPVSIYRQ